MDISLLELCPTEGHKDMTGKFWVGSVNLFYVSDHMSGKPSRKLTFVLLLGPILLLYCLGTDVRAYILYMSKLQIIGKVNMETTGMWGLTLILFKDIKCFEIWAYFEGIGTNFNFEEPPEVCMHDITGRCNICQNWMVGLFTLRFHLNVNNCSGIRIKTIKIILQCIWGWFKLIQ